MLFSRFKATYNNVTETIIQECLKYAGQEAQPTPVTQQTQSPSAALVSSKKKLTWSSFLSSLSCSASSSCVNDETVSLESAIRKEVSLYASLPTLSQTEEDPLMWWRLHQSSFPNLSKLAKKFLCIQATSVPSERLFSAAGNIVTTKRNCLKPAKVNQLCFLAFNC